MSGYCQQTAGRGAVGGLFLFVCFVGMAFESPRRSAVLFQHRSDPAVYVLPALHLPFSNDHWEAVNWTRLRN